MWSPQIGTRGASSMCLVKGARASYRRLRLDALWRSSAPRARSSIGAPRLSDGVIGEIFVATRAAGPRAARIPARHRLVARTSVGTVDTARAREDGRQRRRERRGRDLWLARPARLHPAPSTDSARAGRRRCILSPSYLAESGRERRAQTMPSRRASTHGSRRTSCATFSFHRRSRLGGADAGPASTSAFRRRTSRLCTTPVPSSAPTRGPLIRVWTNGAGDASRRWSTHRDTSSPAASSRDGPTGAGAARVDVGPDAVDLANSSVFVRAQLRRRRKVRWGKRMALGVSPIPAGSRPRSRRWGTSRVRAVSASRRTVSSRAISSVSWSSPARGRHAASRRRSSATTGRRMIRSTCCIKRARRTGTARSPRPESPSPSLEPLGSPRRRSRRLAVSRAPVDFANRDDPSQARPSRGFVDDGRRALRFRAAESRATSAHRGGGAQRRTPSPTMPPTIARCPAARWRCPMTRSAADARESRASRAIFQAPPCNTAPFDRIAARPPRPRRFDQPPSAPTPPSPPPRDGPSSRDTVSGRRVC